MTTSNPNSKLKSDATFSSADTVGNNSLNVISRISYWDNENAHLLSSGKNLPASVPALLALQRMECPYLTTSAVLLPEDYREVWQKSLRSVLHLMRDSEGREGLNEPNIAFIHARSMFYLLSEIDLFGKFLEKRHGTDPIDEVRVEAMASQMDDSNLYFGSSLFSPFFQEVAMMWATSRGIPVKEIRSSAEITAGGRGSSRGLMSTFLFAPRQMSRKIYEDVRRSMDYWLGIASTVRYLLGGGRRLVFYVPFRSAGLGARGPSFAVNIQPWLRLLTKIRSPMKWMIRIDGPALKIPLDFERGDFPALFRRRCLSFLEKSIPRELISFNFFNGLLKALSGWGVKSAFLAVAPFIESQGQGYVAEAFRKRGCPVGGVQHGGNMGLVKEWAVPNLLADYREDYFFHWGNAPWLNVVADSFSCKSIFVQTGSPRTRELLRMTENLPGSNVKQKIRTLLYAPTHMNLSGFVGNISPWDRYVQLFSRVCGILNRSRLECTVKTFAFPEFSCFDRRMFPNIRFVQRAGFVDFMGQFDCLLTDSLGGSPIYEALATQKPILLYGGGESQTRDPHFLQKLKKRVVCYFDEVAYFKGLEHFLSDPEGFIATDGVEETNTEVLNEFLPSTTPEDFWWKVRRTFFEVHA